MKKKQFEFYGNPDHVTLGLGLRMDVDPGSRGTGPPSKNWSGRDINIDVPKVSAFMCIYAYDITM